MKIHLLFAALLLSGQAFAFPWYAQGENFRGAQLMTPEERKIHIARLQGMKSFEECRGYMNAHYLELDRRAKEKGALLPPVQGDPCEVMKTMGRFR
ncbi:MAG: hypothetical protein FD187_1884 [bacterium]|nr:MAG: hypothetical protein FD142_1724 [bacterium]KAF0148461.1 MAG: hypothetical protein FD187_1884 [bacterium]KAF0168005.1 MAG: hypothetical protein FD158_1732 [bacterium]TXT21250.1 MAG: hypothetical protein FD132_760 [bacterium]